MFPNSFWGNTTTSSGSGSGVPGGLTLEEVQGVIDSRVTKPYVTNLGIPGEPSPIVPSSTTQGNAAVADRLEYANTDELEQLWFALSMGGLGQSLELNLNSAKQFARDQDALVEQRVADTYYKKTDTVNQATNSLQLGGVPANGYYLKTDKVAQASVADLASAAGFATNAKLLDGLLASEYYLKSDKVAQASVADLATSAGFAMNAKLLDGLLASEYYLKTDTVANATNSSQLGGVAASQYMLKTVPYSRLSVVITNSTSVDAESNHLNKVIYLSSNNGVDPVTYVVNSTCLAGVDTSVEHPQIQLINRNAIGRLYVSPAAGCELRGAVIGNTYSTPHWGCMTLCVMWQTGTGHFWMVTGDVDIDS